MVWLNLPATRSRRKKATVDSPIVDISITAVQKIRTTVSHLVSPQMWNTVGGNEK
jgi:hypothetical protein